MDEATLRTLRADMLAQGWVEDIVQEVLCLMLEKGVAGKPADLRKWAFSAARRLRLKEWRHAKRHSPLPDEGTEDDEHPASTPQVPADQLRRLAALEDIEQAPPALVEEALGRRTLTRQNRAQRRKVLRKRLEVPK